MAVTQYIGSRYVPIFAEPEEWTEDATYEPLTIVTCQGNSYTSKQYVPKGIEITNRKYWAVTGNYNAQVEQYRVETREAVEHVDEVGEQAQKNADAAGKSEAAAKASETNAAASATAAANSAAAAKTSETNAADSAKKAHDSYGQCDLLAQNAQSAESAASKSAQNAALSAQHALTHSEQAEASAKIATNSASTAAGIVKSVKLIDSGVRRHAGLNSYENHKAVVPCWSDFDIEFNETFSEPPNVIASLSVNITIDSSTGKPSPLEAKSSMELYVHDVTATKFSVRIFNTGDSTSPESFIHWIAVGSRALTVES